MGRCLLLKFCCGSGALPSLLVAPVSLCPMPSAEDFLRSFDSRFVKLLLLAAWDLLLLYQAHLYDPHWRIISTLRLRKQTRTVKVVNIYSTSELHAMQSRTARIWTRLCCNLRSSTRQSPRTKLGSWDNWSPLRLKFWNHHPSLKVLVLALSRLPSSYAELRAFETLCFRISEGLETGLRLRS